MGTIQIKRGLKANLPSEAVIGALLYTIDEKFISVTVKVRH